MKKLLVILAVLSSWQSAAFCAIDGTKDKDEKEQVTEIVEIKGKYDNQGSFRVGLQMNTGLMFLTRVESTESHLNAFTDFGVVAEKFIVNKTWALSTGVSFTAYKLSTTTQDNEEVPASQGTFTRTDMKGSNIHIPLNLKYRSDLIGKRSKLYALAGASLCLQTGSGRKTITPVSANGVVLSQGKAVGGTSNANGCSLNFGTGMQFNTGGLRTLSVGLQYQKGLGFNGGVDALIRDNMSMSFGFFF